MGNEPDAAETTVEALQIDFFGASIFSTPA